MGAVLVTGGMGFIGSHTCVELIKAGYEVISVDNFMNSKRDIPEKIEKITGIKIKNYDEDILDDSALKKIFTENEINSVIHFAGFKAVGESIEKPLEYYENNVGGIIKLLKVMRNYNCKKIVFSSSATVYGINNPVPNKEDMPTSAINPYGYTKIMIEQILKDLSISDEEWRILSLRYFNPIGAHKSGLIGENPNGIPNNILPHIAQAAIEGAKEVSIYGNDYLTNDGTGIRDYIHICDLANGHISALDYLESNKGYEVINLGSGRGYSVLELIDAYEKASGQHIARKFVERREGDIAISLADIEKAKSLLSWQPKHSIEEMCEDSWRYIKNNM